MKPLNRSLPWAAFVLCFAIILWRAFMVPLEPDSKARNHVRGDAYSDINTYSALQYFYDAGFSSIYYLPVHNYDAWKAGAEPYVYTHYPALPDILAGVYAKLLHSTDTRLIRLFPIVLSMLWFWLIFGMLKRMIPDPRKALVAALALVLSNYFIAWADNLHKHMYEEFFKWLFVFLLWRYYERAERSKGLLLVLALLFMAAVNVSFEPAVFLAVVTIGFSLIYTRRLFTTETIVLGLASVVGVGLHLWQNALYFGSWATAISDLTDSAALRTVGDADSQFNEMHRSLGVMDYLKIPLEWVIRSERYFAIPGWAMLPLGWLAFRDMKKHHPKLYKISWVLLIAGVAWSLLMAQHFIVHLFTTKNIGVFYGFIGGYGLVVWWDWLQQHRQQGQTGWLVIHGLFAAYIAGMFLYQHVWELYIQYGFAYGAL